MGVRVRTEVRERLLARVDLQGGLKLVDVREELEVVTVKLVDLWG